MFHIGWLQMDSSLAIFFMRREKHLASLKGILKHVKEPFVPFSLNKRPFKQQNLCLCFN